VSERDEAVDAICAKTGKTPEQANAFLDILGSAFRRRGWSEGEPLSQEEIEERLGTFLEETGGHDG
jgi:hypothetical protein